jgi:hypothetical protein
MPAASHNSGVDAAESKHYRQNFDAIVVWTNRAGQAK